MNIRGSRIPTAWLIIIPLVNFYWYWKWCEGVETTTKNSISTVVAFLLICVLGFIAMPIIQDKFNKIMLDVIPEA